ncbi:MAG: hypothetical protein GYB68_12335 [Chloroflexi bacterium]|nr:hypothetical protein [Chloroflexota bacterium]
MTQQAQSPFDFIKSHTLALILFALATVIMTLPMIFNLSSALPSDGIDIYPALWQNWWLREVVTEGHNPSYAPDLFYPQGFDTTFQPRRWPGLITWLPLAALFGDIAAYNLNALGSLWLSAAATYLLVVLLTQNRVAGWIAGALYAFYPQHLTDVLQQPNTGHIHWIPVFMLLLVLALHQLDRSDADQAGPVPTVSRRLPVAVAGASSADQVGRVPREFRQSLILFSAAALALSVSAYINLKIWVLAGLTGALYLGMMMFVKGWVKRRDFWIGVGWFTFVGLLITLPITLPYLRAAWLGSAISEWAPHYGADILSFVQPTPDVPPFVAPWMATCWACPHRVGILVPSTSASHRLDWRLRAWSGSSAKIEPRWSG